jgi:hypothetical protein
MASSYVGTNSLGIGGSPRTQIGYQAPQPEDPVLTFLRAASAGAPPPTPQQQYQDALFNPGSGPAYIGNQQQTDFDYHNQLMGYLGQQQGNVNTANAANSAALGNYHSAVDPLIGQINGIQAPTWQNYASNPQDVQRQQQAFDWASGAANGSLDYQAQLAGYQSAGYQTANYQTYQAQQAALSQAALSQYASNPQDVQRQLTGLGNIEQDIATGGAGQEKILEQIYEDLQRGGDGQRDAIARLRQELATGGNDQREVLEKYKALSDPNITAQERYLAEIARRSFESQDRGSREAVLSDQAARGVRSGASEIASSLANQERFGQDRTLAELGLQANAVGRSMQALGGWQQSADSLRAAQQNGLAMYTQANNALRAAQQNGMGMAANEENALREASQRGLAMYQTAADSIRDMNDRVGLSNTGWANENAIANAGFANANSQFNANATNQANQFNANAYNDNQQFNANAYNSNQQFNAGAYNTNQIANAGFANQASANNQNARLQGGVAMNNTANSIRSANDAIGMFNTQGSQTSKQFAAELGFQKADATSRIAQNTFTNDAYVTDSTFTRNSGLNSQGVLTSGAIHNDTTATDAEAQRRRDAARQEQLNFLAGRADPMPPRPSFTIPGISA